MMAANKWMFRTTLSKCFPQDVTFPSNGTPGQFVVNFGQQAWSLKSLEAVVVSGQAVSDPSVASKTTFPDNGINMWQYRVGNSNTLIPAYAARCGYGSSTTTASNQLDGYILYNNYRSSKCSQDRDYRFASAGCINNFTYDGSTNYSWDSGSGATTSA